jgi:hypothetical protein
MGTGGEISIVSNGTVLINNQFHPSYAFGSAGGISVNLRFGWHTAVRGTANGISIEGWIQ